MRRASLDARHPVVSFLQEQLKIVESEDEGIDK